MNGILAVLAAGGAATFTWGSLISCQAIYKAYWNPISCYQPTMMSPVQYTTMQGQPMVLVPQPRINQGIPQAYESGYAAGYAAAYSAQRTVMVPAPSYPVSFTPNTTPIVDQLRSNCIDSHKV